MRSILSARDRDREKVGVKGTLHTLKSVRKGKSERQRRREERVGRQRPTPGSVPDAMSQSATPHDGSHPDDNYPPPSPHAHPDENYPPPSPHAHPDPHSHHPLTATTTTTTPTPTPSPPPPPASAATTTNSAATTSLPASSSSSTTSSSSSASSTQLAAQHQQILREAVSNGDSSGLRRLLEAREGKINLNVLDTEGQSVLHESCQRGDLDLVKLLVRFGADVRLANRDGWSAVHIAAFGGHTDILLYLMKASTLSCGRS
ncbi:apoptosis-stimulating of p53 protein 2-like [Littorina saxatilis]|uniref:apoptosis-stimulating of p53 protein 2-like n=1 Tax=Littorina saxatilis TaxID=31220 RepID=UPI0038B62A92